jgi:hypothetical protein
MGLKPSSNKWILNIPHNAVGSKMRENDATPFYSVFTMTNDNEISELPSEHVST